MSCRCVWIPITKETLPMLRVARKIIYESENFEQLKHELECSMKDGKHVETFQRGLSITVETLKICEGVDLSRVDLYEDWNVPDEDLETCLRVLRTLERVGAEFPQYARYGKLFSDAAEVADKITRFHEGELNDAVDPEANARREAIAEACRNGLRVPSETETYCNVSQPEAKADVDDPDDNERQSPGSDV